MKINSIAFSSLLLIITAIYSCSKKSTPTPPAEVSYDVYISGVVNTNFNSIPVIGYWKNGTFITENSGLYTASIKDIGVGDDVHPVGTRIAGTRIPGGTPSYSLANVATYWKNGRPINLVTDTVKSSSAFKVYVDKKDVYILGSIHDDSIPQPMIWKNGVATPLQFSSPAIGGRATAIAVSGNDVYVAGDAYVAGYYGMAIYWKNGVQVALSAPDSRTVVNAITVDGNDVYLAGQVSTSDYMIPIATYWKNGIPHSLTTDTISAQISSIAIQNNNVYVAGKAAVVRNHQTNNLLYSFIYWKNGVIANPNWTSSKSDFNNISVSNIAMADTNAYVAGTYNNSAVYWKNGQLNQLSSSGSASGIFIVKH